MGKKRHLLKLMPQWSRLALHIYHKFSRFVLEVLAEHVAAFVDLKEIWLLTLALFTAKCFHQVEHGFIARVFKFIAVVLGFSFRYKGRVFVTGSNIDLAVYFKLWMPPRFFTGFPFKSGLFDVIIVPWIGSIVCTDAYCTQWSVVVKTLYQACVVARRQLFNGTSWGQDYKRFSSMSRCSTQLVSIPRFTCIICAQMYSQSVQPFDHISQAFELLTP